MEKINIIWNVALPNNWNEFFLSWSTKMIQTKTEIKNKVIIDMTKVGLHNLQENLSQMKLKYKS